MSNSNIFQPGSFYVGCNYWASHAGTAMWADWRPDVVDRDFKLLASAGMQVLRVFPLWPDFQPIRAMRGGHGNVEEVRLGEQPLLPDGAGRAGLSGAALQHFMELMDLGAKYQFRFIVSLINGWMSGRLFVPPALDGLNVFTDPFALEWQVRFVRAFVRHARGHPAVAAWGLGNECNVMAPAHTREQAWVWTTLVSQAIRAEDQGRPVFSDMHSLAVTSSRRPWTIQDQAELTDMLTTHPYAFFTPHCDQDPYDSMRTILHATAETCWYADIGRKPCCVEEHGNLGPAMASEEATANALRASLCSVWAHDGRAFLWWCAFDQNHLSHPPYDWCMVERELGLFRQDGSAKAFVAEFSRFRQFLDKLPFRRLPARARDAVCILGRGQDAWGVAFSSFILAKQAGFDIEFQDADQPLKPAPCYLMPCVKGLRVVSRRLWMALLQAVREGATLYISFDGGALTEFEELTGLRVESRGRRGSPAEINCPGIEGRPVVTTRGGSVQLNLRAVRASVLGHERGGNPAFAGVGYGAGKVFFASFPLEMDMTTAPGAFETNSAWQIYRHVFRNSANGRVLRKSLPQIGITEHPMDDRHRAAVIINYGPAQAEVSLTLKTGWALKQVLCGNRCGGKGENICLPIDGHGSAVLELARNG